MDRKDCRFFIGIMTEMIYGQEGVTETEKSAFQRHLTECSSCKAEYKAMNSLVKVMTRRRRPEPGETYWDSYMQRLMERMEMAESTKTDKVFSMIKQPVRFPEFIKKWIQHPAQATNGKLRRWLLYPVTALLLITLGIIIGRYLYISPRSVHFPATAVQVERKNNPAVSEHFENLRPLLIDFANTSLSGDPGGEEELVPVSPIFLKQLLFQNLLLKKIVKRKNDASLKKLLSDLEVILMEISNSRSPNTIRSVQEILKRNDILFKMKIYNMKRQKASIPI